MCIYVLEVTCQVEMSSTDITETCTLAACTSAVEPLLMHAGTLYSCMSSCMSQAYNMGQLSGYCGMCMFQMFRLCPACDHLRVQRRGWSALSELSRLKVTCLRMQLVHTDEVAQPRNYIMVSIESSVMIAQLMRLS